MSEQTRPATEIAAGTLFRVEDYRMCESVGYLVGRSGAEGFITTSSKEIRTWFMFMERRRASGG